MGEVIKPSIDNVLVWQESSNQGYVAKYILGGKAVELTPDDRSSDAECDARNDRVAAFLTNRVITTQS